MVALRKHLDVIPVAEGSLLLVSALCIEPAAASHRPLRERVIERAALLYRSPTGEDSTFGSLTQVVLAVSPLAGPNALTLAAVAYTWFPPHAVCTAPSVDLLHMATSIWQPEASSSRWYSFEAALATATRLAGIRR